MAWVDQSSAFGYGTKLTSTQMQNLRDNLTAFAAQDSGAPSYTLGAGTIDQTNLKTDVEEETGDIAQNTYLNAYFTNIGEYGFWANIKCDSGTAVNSLAINKGISGTYAPQSYTPFGINVGQGIAGSMNIYVQIRYVTASGEIFWVFILKDKKTKKYLKMHANPDHPCICCHDPEAVHHPFFNAYDPEKHEILCIPLSKSERKKVENLREWKNEVPQLTFLETVKKYFDVDENPQNAKWPTIPVTIGVDRNRRVMKAKIPKRDYIKQAKLTKK